MTSGEPLLLEAIGLSKRFGAVPAVTGVNLTVNRGEVVGLVGQNGAGKSTLLKLLSGVIAPDTGQILIHGRRVRMRSVADANRQGIGMVFQEQSLLPNLTVAENVFLGHSSKAVRGGVYRWKRLYSEAELQLAKVGEHISPSAVVADLPFAERQSVELARVLALEESVQRPMLILLDEPTSILSGREIDRLFLQIDRLKSRAGIVFVSHRLDEVTTIANRFYVLRDGVNIAERRRDEVDENELFRLMVGNVRASDYYAKRTHDAEASTAVRLRVEDLCHVSDFDSINLKVSSGSILGIAGVVGSGRETLCRALFGAEPFRSGRIFLDGKAVNLSSPARAVQLGVGYVPAERRTEGIVVGRSVTENILLPPSRVASRAGVFFRRRNAARTAKHLVQRLHIKAPSVIASIDKLSGGNQQKCVLAKWLILPDLRVLILDHPTRGLDVQAKADVYVLIRQAASSGVAIVLLSDTLEELLGLSDEIVTMRDGRITGEFYDISASPPSPEDLIRLMV